jgi:hypothetical protein
LSEGNLILTNQCLVFLNLVALLERQAEGIQGRLYYKFPENGITTLLGLKD